MKYALCVKLYQHDFTIVIVVKLLVIGHCSDSGLHILSSRSLYTHTQTERERNRADKLRMISSLQSSGDYRVPASLAKITAL